MDLQLELQRLEQSTADGRRLLLRQSEILTALGPLDGYSDPHIYEPSHSDAMYLTFRRTRYESIREPGKEPDSGLYRLLTERFTPLRLYSWRESKTVHIETKLSAPGGLSSDLHGFHGCVRLDYRPSMPELMVVFFFRQEKLGLVRIAIQAPVELYARYASLHELSRETDSSGRLIRVACRLRPLRSSTCFSWRHDSSSQVYQDFTILPTPADVECDFYEHWVGCERGVEIL